jgi:hypothetical protein
MAPRFGQTRDQFGLPVIPNTRDYVFPNPINLNGRVLPQFPVQLDAIGNVAGDGISYSWTVVGNGLTRSSNSADAIIDLPEGSYTVTLNASFNGTAVSTAQNITVRNFLIAAIGDSYSSGEGNPHSPQQYGGLGFTTRGAIWANSPDAQEALFHRMGHRSAHAGVAQAALWLENSDPKTSGRSTTRSTAPSPSKAARLTCPASATAKPTSADFPISKRETPTPTPTWTAWTTAGKPSTASTPPTPKPATRSTPTSTPTSSDS